MLNPSFCETAPFAGGAAKIVRYTVFRGPILEAAIGTSVEGLYCKYIVGTRNRVGAK
jgi:hypothetical protein